MSLTNPKCDDVTFCQLNMYYAFSIYPAFYRMHNVLSVATVDHFMGHLHLGRDILSRLRIARCRPPAHARSHVIYDRSYCCSVIGSPIHPCLKTMNLVEGSLGGCIVSYMWVCLFVCMCGWLCVYMHGCVFTNL